MLGFWREVAEEADAWWHAPLRLVASLLAVGVVAALLWVRSDRSGSDE